MSLILKTGRFGELNINESEKIHFPQGILGFADLKNFCLIDPGDETLILWLQSMEQPNVAFALLEPRIFKADYTARLSASELRELELVNVNQSAVFTILTIPERIDEMTSNLKAPIVINLKKQIGKQVVLQENEYSIKHLMFKELKAHLMTIQAQKRRVEEAEAERKAVRTQVVTISDIPPSLTVKNI